MAIVVWIDNDCDVVWREGIPTRDYDWDESLADRAHRGIPNSRSRWGYWMILE